MKIKHLAVLFLLTLCGCSVPKYIRDDQRENPNFNTQYELNDETFMEVKLKDRMTGDNLYVDFKTKGYKGLAYFDAKVNISIEVSTLMSTGHYETKEFNFTIDIDQDGRCSKHILVIPDITSYANFVGEYEFEGYALAKGEY